MSPTPEEAEAVARLTSKRDHARLYLTFALHSVRDLRQYAHDAADLPPPAVIGCREAFYMNARLIAGFFVRGRDRRDWHASDFLPDWTAPEPLRERLDRVWTAASQHVAHLSKARTPKIATPPEDLSLAG